MDYGGVISIGACSLLCKIFLQFLPRLESYAELDLLWVKLLEYLKKFMLKNETKSGVLVWIACVAIDSCVCISY